MISIAGIIAFGFYYLPTLTVRAPRGYDSFIQTPGGEIPFRFILWPNNRGTKWGASIDIMSTTGGPEPDEFSLAETVSYDPKRGDLRMLLTKSDSELALQGETFAKLSGTWTVLRENGDHVLPVRSVLRGDGGFVPLATDEPRHDFSSIKRLRDADDDFHFELILYARSDIPDIVAECLPLIPTGHLMQGRIDGRVMRLAYFDGDNAYLLRAEYLGEGEYQIDLWNGSWEHRTLVPVMP